MDNFPPRNPHLERGLDEILFRNGHPSFRKPPPTIHQRMMVVDHMRVRPPPPPAQHFMQPRPELDQMMNRGMMPKQHFHMPIHRVGPPMAVAPKTFQMNEWTNVIENRQMENDMGKMERSLNINDVNLNKNNMIQRRADLGIESYSYMVQKNMENKRNKFSKSSRFPMKKNNNNNNNNNNIRNKQFDRKRYHPDQMKSGKKKKFNKNEVSSSTPMEVKETKKLEDGEIASDTEEMNDDDYYAEYEPMSHDVSSQQLMEQKMMVNRASMIGFPMSKPLNYVRKDKVQSSQPISCHSNKSVKHIQRISKGKDGIRKKGRNLKHQRNIIDDDDDEEIGEIPSKNLQVKQSDEMDVDVRKKSTIKNEVEMKVVEKEKDVKMKREEIPEKKTKQILIPPCFPIPSEWLVEHPEYYEISGLDPKKFSGIKKKPHQKEKTNNNKNKVNVFDNVILTNDEIMEMTKTKNHFQLLRHALIYDDIGAIKALVAAETEHLSSMKIEEEFSEKNFINYLKHFQYIQTQSQLDDQREKLELMRKNVYKTRDQLNNETDKVKKEKLKKELVNKLILPIYPNRIDRSHYGRFTSDDTDDRISLYISQWLGEPKTEFIKRCVKKLGRVKTLSLFFLAEDIVNIGGWLTKDKKRSRTSGGIFFALLKRDYSLDQDVVKEILDDDVEVKAKKKKQSRQRKRQQLKEIEKNLLGKEDKKETNKIDILEEAKRWRNVPPPSIVSSTMNDPSILLQSNPYTMVSNQASLHPMFSHNLTVNETFPLMVNPANIASIGENVDGKIMGTINDVMEPIPMELFPTGN
ncbi:hypothetical protein SNEBB_001191 [Seison nebaliae]|nr:hypothetical protein SNEBB_001191 [Seison nebaliae]